MFHSLAHRQQCLLLTKGGNVLLILAGVQRRIDSARMRPSFRNVGTQSCHGEPTDLNLDQRNVLIPLTGLATPP